MHAECSAPGAAVAAPGGPQGQRRTFWRVCAAFSPRILRKWSKPKPPPSPSARGATVPKPGRKAVKKVPFRTFGLDPALNNHTRILLALHALSKMSPAAGRTAWAKTGFVFTPTGSGTKVFDNDVLLRRHAALSVMENEALNRQQAPRAKQLDDLDLMQQILDSDSLDNDDAGIVRKQVDLAARGQAAN